MSEAGDTAWDTAWDARWTSGELGSGGDGQSRGEDSEESSKLHFESLDFLISLVRKKSVRDVQLLELKRRIE